MTAAVGENDRRPPLVDREVKALMLAPVSANSMAPVFAVLSSRRRSFGVASTQRRFSASMAVAESSRIETMACIAAFFVVVASHCSTTLQPVVAATCRALRITMRLHPASTAAKILLCIGRLVNGISFLLSLSCTFNVFANAGRLPSARAILALSALGTVRGTKTSSAGTMFKVQPPY